MDIAKYIGLFLLKNRYCYIHGLGTLELKRTPSSQQGENLTAPAYSVVISPKGSIDDSLANFIATNEQISISKAANALREFSEQSKAALHEGKEIIIPAAGKFVAQNGKIGFITDPHLQYTPPDIYAPKEKREERTEAQKIAYADTPASRSGVNWGKVILGVAIIVALGAVVIFGVNYIRTKGEETKETTDVLDTIPQVVEQPVAVDTTAVDTTATPAAIQAQNGMLSFKVVIKSSRDSNSIAKRVRTLTTYGNTVEMVMKDSVYHAVIPITAPTADTTRVLDSLKATFNPNGVSIFR